MRQLLYQSIAVSVLVLLLSFNAVAQSAPGDIDHDRGDNEEEYAEYYDSQNSGDPDQEDYWSECPIGEDADIAAYADCGQDIHEETGEPGRFCWVYYFNDELQQFPCD